MEALILVALITAVDPKVCGSPTDHPPPPNKEVLTDFKSMHPCPDLMNHCNGWVVEYVVPLECGGCDAPVNMQWMPKYESEMKQKWDVRIYCGKTRGGKNGSSQ
jgi:hypothetical protein